MKKQRCYIYTRVSTAMQVDGFSLDAQKEKLKKYADYQDMVVVREFSDEGKSGKNVDGRPQFKEKLELIEAGTDDIDYVLVFKLSRFGRNAADVLSSLQKMQDFGVNLICVEDGIDSSKDAGKLMISVLSAVAEIERDNILVQTMEGRKQKAREGKWNGGFAPYGYKLVDKCDYHKQWGQDIVNDAVAELIKKMVTSPDFEKGIREKIAARVDTSELEQELDGLKKKMRQLEVSKDKIAIQMDNLDVTDSMYEKKYDDLQKRFYDKYDEMALTENHMDEIQSRLAHIRRKQLSGDRIYNFLIAFDKLYDKLSDAEKKEFMGTFVESIELYPERLENGKFLKHIHFRFPVYYNGTVIDDISWENESTVETVCLLSKLHEAKHHVNVMVDMDELDITSAESKATYEEIKSYMAEHNEGMKVSNLYIYIAQVKAKYGIIERENYNKPKSDDTRQPKCPKEKEDAIVEALEFFKMI